MIQTRRLQRQPPAREPHPLVLRLGPCVSCSAYRQIGLYRKAGFRRWLISNRQNCLAQTHELLVLRQRVVQYLLWHRSAGSEQSQVTLALRSKQAMALSRMAPARGSKTGQAPSQHHTSYRTSPSGGSHGPQDTVDEGTRRTSCRIWLLHCPLRQGGRSDRSSNLWSWPRPHLGCPPPVYQRRPLVSSCRA